jgi:hypothetical protein
MVFAVYLIPLDDVPRNRGREDHPAREEEAL